MNQSFPDWVVLSGRHDLDFPVAFHQLTGKTIARPSHDELSEHQRLADYWYSCAVLIYQTIRQSVVLSDVTFGSDPGFTSSLPGMMNANDREQPCFWANAFQQHQWPPFAVVSLLLGGLPVDGLDIYDEVSPHACFDSLETCFFARAQLARRFLSHNRLNHVLSVIQQLFSSEFCSLQLDALPTQNSTFGDFLLIPTQGILQITPVSDSIVATFRSFRILLAKGVLLVPFGVSAENNSVNVSWHHFLPRAPLMPLIKLFLLREGIQQDFNKLTSPNFDITIRHSDSLKVPTPVHANSSASFIPGDTSLSDFERSFDSHLSGVDHPIFENLRNQWNSVYIAFRNPAWRLEQIRLFMGIIDNCLQILREAPDYLVVRIKDLMDCLVRFGKIKGLEVLPEDLFAKPVLTGSTEAGVVAEFMNGVSQGEAHLVHAGWSFSDGSRQEPVLKICAGAKSEGLIEFEKMVAACFPSDHPLISVVQVWATAALNDSLARDVVLPIINCLYVDVELKQIPVAELESLRSAACVALQAQSGISFQFMSTADKTSFDSDTCENIFGSGVKGARIKRFLSPLVLNYDNTIILKARVELQS